MCHFYFTDLWKGYLAEWFGEGKMQESPDYGRIITQRHFDRLLNMLNSTKGKLALGTRILAIGLFSTVPR